MEFKKSSLPDSRKKPNTLFIPSRFLQESKQELCQRVLKLEEENDDLREQNFLLKWKLDKLKTSATTPLPPPKEDKRALVWAIPLACAKLGAVAPVSYHHHMFYLYLCFSLFLFSFLFSSSF